MKAATFAAVVRDKHRITIPRANNKAICRVLKIPDLDGYLVIVKILKVSSGNKTFSLPEE